MFDWPELRAAVVNVDDEHGAALAAELADGSLDLWTVSRHGPARLRALDLRYVADGLGFEVVESGPVWTEARQPAGPLSQPA